MDFVLKRKGEASWITWMKRQVFKRNNNVVIPIVGPVGSGKSWSCLSICESVDPTFNADRIYYEALPMIRAVRATNPDGSYKLPKGSAIMFEEIQIAGDSRQWWQKTNMALRYLFSTFRFRGLIVMLNLPTLSRLDKAIAELRDGTFETKGIRKEDSTSLLKCKTFRLDPLTGKDYNEYLRSCAPGIRARPVMNWRIKRPSKDLVVEYEKKKADYNLKLQEELERVLMEEELKKKKKKKELTELQILTLELLNKGFTVEGIAENLNISGSAVRNRIRSLQQNHGYKIVPVKGKDGRTILRYAVRKEVMSSE